MAGEVVAVSRCRIIGHRYRFTAHGRVLTWRCARCGTVGGERRYGSAEDAARYARALDREDRDRLGTRAPLVGLFPLRLYRAIHRRG